jgi:hypothetical protein
MWLARSEVLNEPLPKDRFFSDVTPYQQGRCFPLLLHTAVCFSYINVKHPPES